MFVCDENGCEFETALDDVVNYRGPLWIKLKKSSLLGGKVKTCLMLEKNKVLLNVF